MEKVSENNYADITRTYRMFLEGAQEGLGIHAHEYRILNPSLDISLVNVEIDAMHNAGKKYVSDVFESSNMEKKTSLFNYALTTHINPLSWCNDDDVKPIKGRDDSYNANADKVLEKLLNSFNNGIADGLRSEGYIMPGRCRLDLTGEELNRLFAKTTPTKMEHNNRFRQYLAEEDIMSLSKKSAELPHIQELYDIAIENSITGMSTDNPGLPLTRTLINVEIDAMFKIAENYVNEIFKEHNPSISAFDILDKFEKVEELKAYVLEVKAKRLSYYSRHDMHNNKYYENRIEEKLSDAFDYGILSTYNKHQSRIRQVILDDEKNMARAFNSIKQAFNATVDPVKK